jgi:hypothetical protein
MRHNASGYFDETALKAITSKPVPGEIYRHKVSGDHLLILATSGKVSACLKLVEYPGAWKIQVNGKTPMYTDPVKIGYCYRELLDTYLGCIPDREMDEVRKAVAAVLGITRGDRP